MINLTLMIGLAIMVVLNTIPSKEIIIINQPIIANAESFETTYIIPKPEPCGLNCHFISSSSIKEFIRKKAEENEVNPEIALFIAKKESNFEWRRNGDGDKICLKNGRTMKSVGLWQIEINCYNTEISEQFALDITSSTEWAMKKIKENPDIWSTWKMRKLWYKDYPL